MKAGPDISRIAALVGDPARCNMLTALMTGRALTASELAQEAGITPQTASSHLAKLEAGGLIEPEKQGRHRYYRLTGDDIAGLLEMLDGLAAPADNLFDRTRPFNRSSRPDRAISTCSHPRDRRMLASRVRGRTRPSSSANARATSPTPRDRGRDPPAIAL